MPEQITTIADLEALHDGDRVVDRYGDVGHIYEGNVEFFETAPLAFAYVIRKYAPLRLVPQTEPAVDIVARVGDLATFLDSAGIEDTAAADAAREIERLRLIAPHEWVANSRRLCSCGASPARYGLPTDSAQWLTWEQWHREHRDAMVQAAGEVASRTPRRVGP